MIKHITMATLTGTIMIHITAKEIMMTYIKVMMMSINFQISLAVGSIPQHRRRGWNYQDIMYAN